MREPRGGEPPLLSSPHSCSVCSYLARLRPLGAFQRVHGWLFALSRNVNPLRVLDRGGSGEVTRARLSEEEKLAALFVGLEGLQCFIRAVRLCERQGGFAVSAWELHCLEDSLETAVLLRDVVHGLLHALPRSSVDAEEGDVRG